jgi:hypothetical protein
MSPLLPLQIQRVHALEVRDDGRFESARFQVKVGQLLLMTVTFVPPPLRRMSVEVLLLASLVSKNQL